MSEDQLSAQSLLTRMVLSDTEGKEVREASDIITTFLMHGRLTEDPEESLESLFLASEILKNQDPSLLSPQSFQKIERLERLKGFADTMDSKTLMKKLFDYTLHPETYGSDENFFDALEAL